MQFQRKSAGGKKVLLIEWSCDKCHGTRRDGGSRKRASEENLDFICAESDLRLCREEENEKGAKLTDGLIKTY